ncbi:MAG: response regulator [Verrucomicrobiota bacterium]
MNTSRTILFVENDPVALEMYRSRLQREGFQLECARDGLEALKALSQSTPDLVVLDMVLPTLSGGDVLKSMRSEARLKPVPVVVFSSTPIPELPPELALAGPTKHLHKTECTFPMLLQAIQDLLLAASNARSPGASSMQGTNGFPAAARDASANAAAEFLSGVLAEIPKIREHCFAYIKAPASPVSLQHLASLYERVHQLSGRANEAGCSRVALLAGAFDALLSEIKIKPSWVTPSVLQTIAQAVDCLGHLVKGNQAELAQPMPKARVLAVDDDAVCNHVIVTTLRRHNFDPKSIDDPNVALDLLQNNPFDLVLLDINMPGMNGFEVCEKLRQLPHCKSTPVIFITGHNNFDNRKQSVLSGGHDFITKPVSPAELALKATIHLLKARVQRGAVSHPATEVVSRNAPPSVPASPVGLPARPVPVLPTTESRTGGMPGSGDAPRAPLRPVVSHPAAAPITGSLPATQPALASSPMTPLMSALGTSAQLAPAATLESAAPAMTPIPLSDVTAPAVTVASAEISTEAASAAPEAPAQLIAPQDGTVSELPYPTTVSGNNGAEVSAAPAEGVVSEDFYQESDSPAASSATEVTGEHAARGGVRSGEAPQEILMELSMAQDMAKEAQEAYQQELARSEKLESEIQELRKQLENAASAAPAPNPAELQELQGRLNSTLQELEQARSGAEQLKAEQARLQAEFTEQLNAARAQAGQFESSLKEKDSRCAQLESEIAEVRKARGSEQAQSVADREAAATRAQAELKELQERINQSQAELEQAKSAVARGETALQEKDARCSQLEADLAGLRQAQSDLQARLTAAQESAERNQAELKQLQDQAAQRQSELEHAKSVASQAESALKEKEARCGQLESELSGVRQSQQEFQSRQAADQEALAKAQNEVKDLHEWLEQSLAEAEQAKAANTQSESALKGKESRIAELEQEVGRLRHANQELETLRSTDTASAAAAQTEIKDLHEWLEQCLAELEQAKEAATRQDSSMQEKISRCAQLETELAGLRQAGEQFNAERASIQETLSKAQGEVQELQNRLNQSHEELEQVRGGHGQAESALKEKEARCAQLESELANLRQAGEQFNAERASIQETLSKAQSEVQELQNRLNQSHAELEQVRGGHGQAESALKEKEARCAQLESELSGLRQAGEQFNAERASIQETLSKAQGEVQELQNRLNQSHAELEQVRGGHGQAESALKEKEARCAQLESELSGLRQASEQFNAERASIRKL